MARRAHNGEFGELTVGYNDFAINGALPAIVRAYRSRYPEVLVSLTTMTSPQMAQALVEGTIDVGFLTGQQYAKGLGAFLVKEKRLVCLVPEAHPLAIKRRLSPRHLDGCSFVEGHPQLWSSFLTPVHEYCRVAGCSINVVQTAQYSDGILGLVEAGMGLAFYVENERLRYRQRIVVRNLVGHTPRFQTLAV
jgi:DNA-binding transcriptional LysR family regulator